VSPKPDLVGTLKGRLAEVDSLRATVAAQIADLEERAKLLNDEQLHLRALLSTYTSAPEKGGDPSERQRRLNEGLEPTEERVSVPGTSSWTDAAITLLRSDGRPIHYRVLHDKLRALGHVFGGQNPPATFLSLLVREKTFVRAGRGTYWLAAEPVPIGVAPELPPTNVSHRARSIRRTRRKVA
jgi:hypothetical protein